MEQAGKEETQMECSMLNASLEEWIDQKQFNPDATTVLAAGYANVYIAPPQKHHRHYYVRIFY